MSQTQTRNLRRWVAALESGEYKQTRQVLHNGRDGYCCLGVWCRLDRNARWNAREGMYEIKDDGEPLPLEDENLGPLAAHLGLTDEEETAYIDANDRGKSFKAIAAMIRKNHPEVFA